MLPVDAGAFVALLFVAFLIIGCSALFYHLEIYRVLPGWGPIRHFDCSGNEDLRINQTIIQRQADLAKDAVVELEFHVAKGSYPIDTQGLEYRWSKNHEDRVGGHAVAKWGTRVFGQDTGDGWIRVGGKYLPKIVKGYPVVHIQEGGVYGGVGKCTWGYCEAERQYREKVQHPVLGEVCIRHDFADTQYLRAHSGFWARDEPHFLEECALNDKKLMINAMNGELPRHCMA